MAAPDAIADVVLLDIETVIWGGAGGPRGSRGRRCGAGGAWPDAYPASMRDAEVIEAAMEACALAPPAACGMICPDRRVHAESFAALAEIVDLDGRRGGWTLCSYLRPVEDGVDRRHPGQAADLVLGLEQ